MKHGCVKYADTNGRPQKRVIVAFTNLTDVHGCGVVRQTLRQTCWQTGLHFDVVSPAGRITSSDIQDGQFVGVVFFAKNRVHDFDVGDLNFAAKDRVEKVQCYRWMLRTSKQQFECVVNGGVDADGHERSQWCLDR